MATFKPVIFKSKNHIGADGTTNIKIRVYHNKDSRYIATPYYVEPAIFDNGEVLPEHPEAATLNYEIGELKQMYLKHYLNLGASRSEKLSCAELRDHLLKVSKINSSTGEFIDFVAFAQNIIDETKKENTIEWYQTGINALCWFYGKRKINALDVTANRMNEMIKRLREGGLNGKPLAPGGISAYMRAIRSLYEKCRNYYNEEDLGIIRIPNNPFKKIEIPKSPRRKKNVPINAVKMIRDHECSKKRQIIARDMFMAMFYLMGINVYDLYHIDGLTFGRVEYERSKTDRDDNIYKYPLSIKVEPELATILEKYSKNGFLSEIKARYNCPRNLMKAVNNGLKEICHDLKIPKVTTNWARHSWSSIARNTAKIPVADIDFCLGHVNNDYKMADVYIEIDYGIYDEANRKVLDLLL